MAAKYTPNNRLNRTSLFWLLGLVALVLLPHIPHLPFWISLLAGSALLLRSISSIDLSRISRRLLLTLLVVITSIGVYIEHGTLLGLQSGVALFVLMLSFKVIESRNFRDGMLVTCLCCFMLITHFLYSQNIPIVIYAIAVTAVIGMTLMQLNRRNAELEVRYLLRSSVVMMLQSLPLVFILFVLFPRLAGPIWALPDDAGTGITGLSDSMSPGEISNLTQSAKVAFRVEFHEQPPPPEQRYWRGPVLWNFDGKTWRGSNFKRRIPAPESSNTEAVTRYKVTLEPHGKPWLFALDIPVSVPRGASMSGDYQLLAGAPVDKRKSYNVESNISYKINSKLATYDRRAALKLPANGARKARQLASEWRAVTNDNPAKIIEQALQHFRNNNYFYTLTPPVLGVDPIDQFLFESRQGFCEHYASSFTVLMRAAGIPARVVTGYSGGEWNPLGNYMFIRQSDAHAWSEVWLDDRGWVRIDPTAAVAPERVLSGINSALQENSLLPFFVRSGDAGSILNRLNLAWDTVNYHWNAWILSYGPDSQKALLEWLGHEHANWQTLIIWMIFGICIFMVVYTVFFLFRNRAHSADPLARLYARLCNKLSTIGLARDATEGPMSFADRIRRARPDVAERVYPVLKRYSELNYSSLQVSDTDIRSLNRQIRNLKLGSN